MAVIIYGILHPGLSSEVTRSVYQHPSLSSEVDDMYDLVNCRLVLSFARQPSELNYLCLKISAHKSKEFHCSNVGSPKVKENFVLFLYCPAESLVGCFSKFPGQA